MGLRTAGGAIIEDSDDRGLERDAEAEVRPAFEARRALYWSLHDFSKGHGLEVGPLHRAMVPRGRADVSYVDVMDRAGLVEHYSDPLHEVPVEEIPDIDYFLIQPDGRTLSLAQAAKAGAPFDWVMASHVVEHVPDVIGWLDQLAEVVGDDGVLVLAVPDKRYTFDVHRPPTTVGQMIESHERGDERPSTRAVYDNFATAVHYNHLDLWRGITPTYDSRVHDVDEALERVRRGRDGEYIDCHVWLYTPDTFLHQMHELRLAGLSKWFIEELVPTPADDIEFRVRMRRIPRMVSSTSDQTGEQIPVSDRPEWVEHQGSWRAVKSMEHRIELLEGYLASSERQLERSRQRSERRLRGVERLTAQLKAQSELVAELRGGLVEHQQELRQLRRRTRRQSTRLAEQSAELDRLLSAPWRRIGRAVKRWGTRD